MLKEELHEILNIYKKKIDFIRRDYEIGIIPKEIYDTLTGEYYLRIRQIEIKYGVKHKIDLKFILSKFLKLISFEYPNLVIRRLNFLMFTTTLFVISLIIGLIYPYDLTPIFGLPKDSALLSDKFKLFSFIVSNNVLIITQITAFGIVLAIPPLITLIINGYVIGSVIALASSDRGILEILSLILPHGFIELTALITSLTVGVEVMYRFFKARGIPIELRLYKTFYEPMKIVASSIVLLMISGFIEAYITSMPYNILPPSAKVAFSIITLIALIIYFVTGSSHSYFRRKV